MEQSVMVEVPQKLLDLLCEMVRGDDAGVVRIPGWLPLCLYCGFLMFPADVFIHKDSCPIKRAREALIEYARIEVGINLAVKVTTVGGDAYCQGVQIGREFARELRTAGTV